MSQLRVGSLVVARSATGVCAEGEVVVCYEEYKIGRRPGWGIIFEAGKYDGFSPEEVGAMLVDLGVIAQSVRYYKFHNVIRLAFDLRDGRFSVAFREAKDLITDERMPA